MVGGGPAATWAALKGTAGIQGNVLAHHLLMTPRLTSSLITSSLITF